MMLKFEKQAYSGSPPHLRGKLHIKQSLYCLVGITPAPAGKTIYITIYLFLAEDHPRTCGENVEKGQFVALVEGSPPHLRGKRLSYCSCVSSSGITPAPAGKTGFTGAHSSR